jgi:glycine cleavage system H protein
MSFDPKSLLYASTHEWVHVEGSAGSKTITVGISAHAIEALTDLVHLELPAVGTPVKAGKFFGEVESVKAVSDLYSPVDGEVVAVNPEVAKKMETLSADPYGAGWLVKIRVANESGLSSLLEYDAYEKQINEEAH